MKIACIGCTNGRSTFTLEINWAYSKESKKIQKPTISTVTKKQDGCQISHRNVERNRRRRERKKLARAQRRKTATSPIVISPAKSATPPKSPMDTLTPGDGEPPPIEKMWKQLEWDTTVKDTHEIDQYGFYEDGPLPCTGTASNESQTAF